MSPPQRDLPGCGGALGPRGKELGPNVGETPFPESRWGVSLWGCVLQSEHSNKQAGCSCRSAGTGTGTRMGWGWGWGQDGMYRGIGMGMG